MKKNNVICAVVGLVWASSIAAVVWAVDYPTVPADHAVWDKSTVTQGDCEEVGQPDLRFWDDKGDFHSEQRTKNVCKYKCSKGHEWKAEYSASSLTTGRGVCANCFTVTTAQ